MTKVRKEILIDVGAYLLLQSDKQYCTHYLEKKYNLNYTSLQKEFKYTFGVSVKEYH